MDSMSYKGEGLIGKCALIIVSLDVSEEVMDELKKILRTN